MQTVPDIKISQYQWWFMVLIFLVSLLARLSYGLSAEQDTPIRADALKYATIGINLVDSGTYSFEESLQTSKLITPGYPFIVAAFVYLFDDFGSAYVAILGFQILLSALVSVLTYVISLRFLNNIAAAVVAVGVAISPHLIVGSAYFLTETTHGFFFIFALFLLLLAVEKQLLWLAVLGGLVFGYSALIRPAVLLFPIPLVVVLWWKYRQQVNLRLSGVFLIAAFAVWTPWQLWEAESDDSNVRQVLALGSYPNMIHESPLYRGIPYREDPQWEAMQTNWDDTRTILMQRFSDRPFTYLQWYLIGKPIMLWSAWAVQGQGGPFIYPVTHSVYNDNALYSGSLRLMMFIHKFLFVFALIAVAAEFVRLVFLHKPAHFLLITLIVFVVYHTAVHMVLAPLPRFSFPYYPVLFILAAHGVTQFVTQIKKQMADD